MSASQQIPLSRQTWLIPFLFIFARFIFYLGMVSAGLFGFGDVVRYYEVAALNGWPYFSYWMEYPPVFSFISTLVYQLSGGTQILYEALMYFLFTGAGAATLFVFQQLDRLILPMDSDQDLRTWVYMVILLVLPYTWWYFEMLPVCMLLVAIYLFFKKRAVGTGLWIGLGILTKWFPALLLPAFWRLKSKKIAFTITAISVGITVLVYAVLWAVSPQMTGASLLSQPNRYSWRTVWAWMDGNYTNGAFAAPADRLNPAYVTETKIGNPPVIPAFPRLILFVAVGLFFWFKTKQSTPLSIMSLIGITWVLFLLWSSGWSPQWILYLIPIILLTFPLQKALLLNILLIMLTLLEWPTLLGHQLFILMGPIVVLRSILFICFIFAWYRQINSPNNSLLQPQAISGM